MSKSEQASPNITPENSNESIRPEEVSKTEKQDVKLHEVKQPDGDFLESNAFDQISSELDDIINGIEEQTPDIVKEELQVIFFKTGLTFSKGKEGTTKKISSISILGKVRTGSKRQEIPQ